jgi:opacity protein-like surface antigen
MQNFNQAGFKGDFSMRKLFFIASILLVCAPLTFAQGATTTRTGPEIFVGYSNLQAEGVPGEDTRPGGGGGGSLDDELFGQRSGLHGINVAVTGFFTPRVGLTGDFSFNKRNQNSDNGVSGTGAARTELDTRVINFLGGPTVKFPNTSRVTPFARILFGVANTRFEAEQSQTLATGTVQNTFETSSTDFAMAVGGGLDVRLNERVGLRVIQFDYNPVFLRDRSVQVLGAAGALVTQQLEGQRQDNLRFSFGVTFK